MSCAGGATACGLRVLYLCTAKDTLTPDLHLNLPAMAGFFESLFLALTLAISLVISLGITVPLTGALVRLRGQQYRSSLMTPTDVLCV